MTVCAPFATPPTVADSIAARRLSASTTRVARMTDMTRGALPVTIARDQDGRVTHLDVRARLPRRRWRDDAPSDEMVATFETFYGIAAKRLGHSQVAAMLVYRSFGIACAERLLAEQSDDVRQLFSRLIAAFVASRRMVARSLRYRSGRNDEGPSTGDVRDNMYFGLVARFCRQAFATLSDEGIVPNHLNFRGVGNPSLGSRLGFPHPI